MKPKPCKVFEVPLYGGTVWVFRTRKSYGEALAMLGEEMDSPDSIDGCLAIAQARDGGVLYLLGVFDKLPSTLVHEVCHLGLAVLNRAGMNPSDSGGEALCYLMGNLVAMLGIDRK